MSGHRLEKIVHAPATLREVVQEKMRNAIITGHFQPGQRLVERPLCEQLDVSRTVIRETIRYLEAEGLVEIEPNKGPIVARLNRKEARQIYDIRCMLETSAAAECAHKISDPIRRQLNKAVTRLEGVSVKQEPAALFQAADMFYEVVFSGAGHEVAWEVVRRLNARISRLRMMTLSAEDRAKPGLEHIKSICSEICAGDACAAQKAVRDHIADASQIADGLLRDHI